MIEKNKIFILDDNESVLRSLKSLLVLSGFEVEASKEPKDAILMIKDWKPDLLILDLMMPELGGFDVLDILNKDEDTKDLPIIIVSAIADYGDIKEVIKKRQFNRTIVCVPKPYNFDHLLKEIKKILNRI